MVVISPTKHVGPPQGGNDNRTFQGRNNTERASSIQAVYENLRLKLGSSVVEMISKRATNMNAAGRNPESGLRALNDQTLLNFLSAVKSQEGEKMAARIATQALEAGLTNAQAMTGCVHWLKQNKIRIRELRTAISNRMGNGNEEKAADAVVVIVGAVIYQIISRPGEHIDMNQTFKTLIKQEANDTGNMTPQKQTDGEIIKLADRIIENPNELSRLLRPELLIW